MNNYTGLEYKVFKRGVEFSPEDVALENGYYDDDEEFRFALTNEGYLLVLSTESYLFMPVNDCKTFLVDMGDHEVRFLHSSRGDNEKNTI